MWVWGSLQFRCSLNYLSFSSWMALFSGVSVCGIFFCCCPADDLPRVVAPSLLDLRPLLALSLSDFTSSLAAISAGPCVVMPLVWRFVSSWPDLVSGVASFCLVLLSWPSGSLPRGVALSVSTYTDPSCMAVVVSYFWFSSFFGFSLCCDASGFGRFVPTTSFGVSLPLAMLDMGHVVLSSVSLLFVLT